MLREVVNLTDLFVQYCAVQAQCLPEVRNDQDIICQAPSSAGKTLLLVISAVQKLKEIPVRDVSWYLCSIRLCRL